MQYPTRPAVEIRAISRRSKSTFTRMFQSLAFGVLLVSTPSSGAPRPSIWVAYEPFFELWERGDRDDLIVTAGHGRPPIFTIRLDGSNPRRAQIRTPANFDGYDLRASPLELSTPPDAFGAAENERNALIFSLRHHWPSIGLVLNRNGSQVIETARSRRYQLCARRRLLAIAGTLAAMAGSPRQREQALRYVQTANVRPGSPTASADLFLQLSSLGLSPAQNGRLMQNARRRMAERQTDDSPSQHSLRDPIILAYGQEYEQHVDLAADLLSARARICRMVALTKIRDPATDRCRIAAVVDRRDGWPLFISILREKTAADGAREGRVDFFSRLAPLRGFVPPPNPCRSA